jgi:hypothetical protein
LTSEIERIHAAAVSVRAESLPPLTDLFERWSEDGEPSLSVEESQHLLDWTKNASTSLDRLIIMLWLGKAHLNLGHKSWKEMVREHELTFRPSREQRRHWHYLMYWQHGMPSRAVAEVTGVDQKTVISDATARHEELLAAGLDSPERDRTITEVTGRTRLPSKTSPTTMSSTSRRSRRVRGHRPARLLPPRPSRTPRLRRANASRGWMISPR